jgi:hypothetical protein
MVEEIGERVVRKKPGKVDELGRRASIEAKEKTCAKSASLNHRVYTEWQLPLSGVHSIMMEKSAPAR